jgi:hypothetical protein
MTFSKASKKRHGAIHTAAIPQFTHYFGKMKVFGKKTVLALALVAVNTNSFAQACDGHGLHHNHRDLENVNDTDLSDEEFPNGLSSKIDGRRTQSHQFRVGEYRWGTLEAFEAAGARCVSADPSPRQVQNSDDILDDYRRRFGSNRRLATAKQIPVYFHIIKPSNGRGGDVSYAQIAEQMDVLNASFQGVTARQGDFVFTYMGTTTTQSNSYYTATYGTNTERQMKSSLRQGGANALNIYTNEPYVSNEVHPVCVPLCPSSLNPCCSFLFIFRTQWWWSIGLGYISRWCKEFCRRYPIYRRRRASL